MEKNNLRAGNPGQLFGFGDCVMEIA